VTSVDANGSLGPVNVIFTVINRRDLDKVIETINSFAPKAFYSVEEVREVSEGVFPISQEGFKNPLRLFRQGKED